MADAKQQYPKVVFSLNRSLDKKWLCLFLQRRSMRNHILATNPNLPLFLKSARTEEAAVSAYVNDFYREHEEAMKRLVQRLQTEWSKTNDKVMEGLEEIMEKKWSKIGKMRAYLTLCSTAGRFLDSHEFQVTFMGKSINEMMSNVLHEITHFLYFDKWRDVFPEDKAQEFSNPHLIWTLSEILVVPIDNDPRVRAYMASDPRIHPDHLRAVLNRNGAKLSLSQYFTWLYKRRILEQKVPFADFLKEAREEIFGMRNELKTANIPCS